MKRKIWAEFFENNNGQKSMYRLLSFMAFFPSSFVVMHTKTDTALGVYLSAYVLGYIGGKAADVFNMKVERE